MSRPRILLTRSWPEGAFAYLKDRYEVTVNETGVPLTQAQLSEAMDAYDALCPTVTDILTKEMLRPGTRVRMIANFGAGFEHIDLEAAKATGIRVSNTPDVLTEATAEIALLLMLMTSRRASEAERGLRDGRWNGWKPTQFLGQGLKGKTLCLVGFGRIGQATAYKAQTALGMKIAYHSRHRVAPEIETRLKARYVDSFDALAAEADVLSLHTPGGESTRHLIDARLLRLMKSTAILINTARGSVVNEADLVHALKAGTIWAAGLDVYEREPQVHPDLLPLDNVVLLPHLGSATRETRDEMGLRAAYNLDRFFAGEPLIDPIA
ncbi:2-hydroxyacid dehydrogenase [Asticcacaulis excentricus]|uniref:D-isomer specific 2-hydroxyacid dehydrogenase NAD-binding protein n=1 Tax=Asticcacaulis excentricus (strain ATCC 15261 / DSM 4724 / KCTC 12464 / NCIMB 9791 / VKM B-1370 / CB 48) TaxID=573065 RepID=E8RVM4_ASTEC|nr:D-glycerate dehydrogenase [Asticcacaulis excentricus]ADU15193.1 D-isomer specific 2-hydroxyacid dehydrogenase NAD-binding protein [Asticcacaulis excentricus CB 48]